MARLDTGGSTVWPRSRGQLEELQRTLATRWAGEPPWRPARDRALRVGAVFAAGRRGRVGAGEGDDSAWAAAVVLLEGRVADSAVVRGRFDAPYAPGLLALREGGLLQEAVSGLGVEPDVVIADATGRDHPRGAGLVIHLGAACGLPTIGVTERPLLATGPEPGTERGAAAELRLEGELVGYRLRTRAGARPVIIHAGWRVGADTGCAVVLSATVNSRTPEPLRQARRLARTARSTDSGLL